MITPALKLTCDLTPFLSDLDILEGSLEAIKSRFGSIHSLFEFMGIDLEVMPATSAGECRVLLKTSDSFRDFISALRAGDI